MNNQNKSVTMWATWVVMPDGYKYVAPTIDDCKEAWIDRHRGMIKDPCWNGFKFIRVPITIPVPNEITNKVAKEEDND